MKVKHEKTVREERETWLAEKKKKHAVLKESIRRMFNLKKCDVARHTSTWRTSIPEKVTNAKAKTVLQEEAVDAAEAATKKARKDKGEVKREVGF